jgi:hypothetical protein
MLIAACGADSDATPVLLETTPQEGAEIRFGGTVTLEFDMDPGSVVANGVSVPLAFSVATVRQLAVTEDTVVVTWDGGGTTVLSFRVLPAARLGVVNPPDGSGVSIGTTVSLFFDTDPGDVFVNGVQADGVGSKRTVLMGEDRTLLVTWLGGSMTLHYTSL